MSARIIAVTGKKRHGKDTVGRILAEQFGFLRVSFADPIKQQCMSLFGLSYDQVYGDLKEVVDERWGKTPREMMQTFGSAARSIHPETWVRDALSKISLGSRGKPVSLHSEHLRAFSEVKSVTNRWAICDCRHENEAAAVRDRGGLIIKVQRPGAGTGLFEDHESEKSVDMIVPDELIKNDGTLQELQSATVGLMKRLDFDQIATKCCKVCGQFIPLTAFPRHHLTTDGLGGTCKGCTSGYQRAYRARHKERLDAYGHHKHVQKKYGISGEQYAEMLRAQGGGCALCGCPPKKRRHAVDHDHRTGQIRGLLCLTCNYAVERFDNVPGWADKVTTYLKREVVGV